MNAGGTAQRVYDALKQRLLAGAVLPGEKLDPAHFADELFSSATPVREALHRLTGERLVETRISGGFFLPRVTEPALRDLYNWNAGVVALAVRLWPRNPPADAVRAPGKARDAIAATFIACAAKTDNRELVAGMSAMNDRLATARVAELQLFADLIDEADLLARAVEEGDPRATLSASRAYHRRRVRAVSAIVHRIYRPAD